MKDLILKLKEETKELKIKYVEKSKEFAILEFNRLSATTQKEVIEQYGYFDQYAKGMRHTKASYARWNKCANIIYNGLEKYVDKKHKEALEHYEFSIEKLAYRIIKKGLDISDVKLVTESCIEKGNISTTLTDGKAKRVTAWTILAWGEINAPHYRYLIK